MNVKTLTVPWEAGLHSRPAACIVENLQKVEANAIAYCKQRTANMDSFLSLVLLEAKKNDEIVVETKGKDAEKAMLMLEKIFKSL